MAQGPEVGQRHPDSEPFDDAMNGCSNITSITVIASQMVHGITVAYSVGGGKKDKKEKKKEKKGKEIKHFNKKAKKEMKNATKHKLELAPDEFITYFGGRSGQVIDCITIATSKGR